MSEPIFGMEASNVALPSEQEFADLIDVRFPYADADRCRELMDSAACISFNASLCVLHEIVLPPHPIELDVSKFRELLAAWRASVDDPLADSFTEYAAQIREIGVGRASSDLAMSLLGQLLGRPGLFAGLAVIAIGGDDEIEQRCERMRSVWSA